MRIPSGIIRQLPDVPTVRVHDVDVVVAVAVACKRDPGVVGRRVRDGIIKGTGDIAEATVSSVSGVTQTVATEVGSAAGAVGNVGVGVVRAAIRAVDDVGEETAETAADSITAVVGMGSGRASSAGWRWRRVKRRGRLAVVGGSPISLAAASDADWLKGERASFRVRAARNRGHHRCAERQRGDRQHPTTCKHLRLSSGHGHPASPIRAHGAS